MAPTSALAIPCDACGAEIEGASIWYGLSKYHPWCWHTSEREAHRPGFVELVRQVVRDEMSRAAQPARSLD